MAQLWFQRIWNEKDESAITELMDPEATGELEGGVQVRGPENFCNFFRTLVTVFPDLQVKVVDTVAEGEKVCVRWEATGTHHGDGMGIKATGAPHQFRGTSWLFVRDGKVVGGADFWNQEGLLARMRACEC